jgi:UDP-2-acetamido-2,6-beta-L-arabino-hexul-4-ose reductase
MSRVLVTGAAGFIGRSLVPVLEARPGLEVTGVDVDSPPADWDRALAGCDAVIHLAGVNRPASEADFETGNVGALTGLLDGLERLGRRPLVVLASSAQAALDNPYGRSKKRAEEALLRFAERTGAPVRFFRLPGVFGKWGRPDYNSVVATFCHRIARDLPIEISDPTREIEIVHLDDVTAAMAALLAAPAAPAAPRVDAGPVFRITLGRLAEMLRAFRAVRTTLVMPDLSDPLTLRLFSTYQSYLPPDGLAYDLVRHDDARGSLAEIFKSAGFGQVFVSRTRPGIVRGNHAHDRKTEKFVVLEGDAVIRFRHLGSGETVEVPVQGRDFRVVDIPPGWAHSIENAGPAEMIVLFWSSELFDPARPDTLPAEVKK